MRVKTDGEINIKFGKERIVFTLLIDLKHKYHRLSIAKQCIRTIACFFFKCKNACSRHRDQLTGSTVCLIARFKRKTKTKVEFATGMYALALTCAGLHKLWYPGIRDRSTWSKFGAHGEHGDVFLFSNLGALWFSENLIRYSLHICLREVKNNLFSFKNSYLRHFSWRF